MVSQSTAVREKNETCKCAVDADIINRVVVGFSNCASIRVIICLLPLFRDEVFDLLISTKITTRINFDSSLPALEHGDPNPTDTFTSLTNT